jgi:predicted transposase/invertase (TIGR01784 family)
MKDRYINPFTDFGFKRIFGEEINKDLLIDFLNELLKGEQFIADLAYKKTESLSKTTIDRKAIFDLYCENDKGEKFIVEIQKTKQKFFKDRSIYYSTFPITEQAEQGEWNYELQAVYTVAILDFTFDDEDHDKTVVSHVQLMDTAKKRVFY